MMKSNFLFIALCALLLCSCSTKRSLHRDSASIAEDNSKTEVTVRTESVKQIEPNDRTLYRFYVIIGSFRSLDNARQWRADMTKKGFSAEILESENGLYRVSAGGYNDEGAARARIAGIRAAYEEHADVWLLVRK